jgi:FkbM family methyltransferase
MKILFGTLHNNIDVTEICYNKLNKNNIITIPWCDHSRVKYFTDPAVGTLKKIFIINKDNCISEYEDFLIISINAIDETITTVNNNDINNAINNKLSNIHSKLQIKYGSFNEEFPEQRMVTRYLTGNEKVLEIGGNIGRNSLIIGSLLQDKDKDNSNNFVVLECDVNISKQLIENRNLNNMNFNIENSALSKRKLIQKGWDTVVSDTLLDGYAWVSTITLDELTAKYNIVFDTLVLDCEGAFYYILMDMPEILNNINLIVMENDYHDLYKKQYIDNILKINNFIVDYSEGGGWGPCKSYFFEVWKRTN